MIEPIRSVTVLGIPFLSTSMEVLVQMLDKRLASSKKTFLVTANPEILMYAKRESSYYKILRQADFVIPDGIGVVLGSKILGQPIQERLAGFDLVEHLFKLSLEKGYKLYFLGAHPTVIRQAVDNVKIKFPKINIVGYQHGYFDMDDKSVIEDIRNKEPDILLIGLGFPKQEQWIEQYNSQLQKGLMIGVGGTFDGLAGIVPRAPEFWRKYNIEWLYRLIKQPSRWRRMLVLPYFIGIIVKERLKKNY